MSDWYETEPVGNTEQTWFINGVIKLVTGIEPDQLLTKIHEIEMRLGRVRDTPCAQELLTLTCFCTTILF